MRGSTQSCVRECSLMREWIPVVDYTVHYNQSINQSSTLWYILYERVLRDQHLKMPK